MAHVPQGAHWRGLGKGGDAKSGNTDGPVKYGARPVVEAHNGVQSVNTDSGIKPTAPKTDDGNTAVNEAFNEAAKGPRERGNVVMIGGK